MDELSSGFGCLEAQNLVIELQVVNLSKVNSRNSFTAGELRYTKIEFEGMINFVQNQRVLRVNGVRSKIDPQ